MLASASPRDAAETSDMQLAAQANEMELSSMTRGMLAFGIGTSPDRERLVRALGIGTSPGPVRAIGVAGDQGGEEGTDGIGTSPRVDKSRAENEKDGIGTSPRRPESKSAHGKDGIGTSP